MDLLIHSCLCVIRASATCISVAVRATLGSTTDKIILVFARTSRGEGSKYGIKLANACVASQARAA
jgi:hypothetical protein